MRGYGMTVCGAARLTSRRARPQTRRGPASRPSIASCTCASQAARSPRGSASTSANGIPLVLPRVLHLRDAGGEHVRLDGPGGLEDDAAHRRVGRLLEHHLQP